MFCWLLQLVHLPAVAIHQLALQDMQINFTICWWEQALSHEFLIYNRREIRQRMFQVFTSGEHTVIKCIWLIIYVINAAVFTLLLLPDKGHVWIKQCQTCPLQIKDALGIRQQCGWCFQFHVVARNIYGCFLKVQRQLCVQVEKYVRGIIIRKYDTKYDK